MPKRKMPKEELIRRVEELIAQGVPKGEAVKKVGIDYSTYYRTRKELAAAASDIPDAPGEMTLEMAEKLRERLREFEKRIDKFKEGQA